MLYSTKLYQNKLIILLVLLVLCITRLLFISSIKYQNKIQNLNNKENTIIEENFFVIASNNLETTIHEASQDRNLIARKIGERMERLMA